MSPPKESTKKATSISTSPVQTNAEAPKAIEPEQKQEELAKTETANAEPLAPPPRPAVGNTPDYFSGNHGLSHETNPFEYSFAGGSTSNGGGLQTPGGTKLPSVAALTSPALPFWNNSAGLRSGPLSPAMLAGPQKDDYFGDGHHLRGGFPTPNESGLRSGLTPGGGGSMFPEPSPNTQAIYSSLAAGGATPTTLDFHRTAMNINARKASEATQAQQSKITSQPQELMNGLDVKPQIPGQFDDANDAANGLYLLAQARNGPQPTNHYAIAPQAIVHPNNMQMGGQSSETSPNMVNRNGGSISTNSGRGVSEMSGGFSDEEQQNRPNTRTKGKRSSTQDNQTNGRRKTNDQPIKPPANKKAKANNGHAMSVEPPSEDEQDMSKDEYNANGKKMTDDEKRKNFLERNRVAALKCRQRKKQWLANLQQKVEMYSVENDSLNNTVAQLRDELVNLKTLLLAHKDCPVAQSQGLSNGGMQHLVDSYGATQAMNPYGMAAAMHSQHQQQLMAGQNYQRRES